jgi:hypothetical protein
MIAEILIPTLRHRFPVRHMRVGSPPAPCAVFPCIHLDVGDIQIYDDGDELTVVAGKFTHGHFSNYDALSAEQKAHQITDDVVAFLDDLFADRIVLWGSHEGSGGWHKREAASTLHKSAKSYVWSGPMESDI